MPNIKYNFNKPWPVFSKNEINIVTKIIKSGKVNYWTGNEGKEFEKEFAEYIGSKNSIAVANGTLALELALHSLEISEGDEVIVPSRTYIATASSVIAAGAVPIMADVDISSGNISVESIQQVMNKKTKAIIVVHLAGWPCDMKAIMNFAKKNRIKVIEDCAQAHGASINGKKIGSFGDASAFSFCQDKIMTTLGEGGMLALKNKEHWLRAWSYKDHGKNFNKVNSSSAKSGFRWLVDSFGSNYRMTEIQAAVGRYQLKKLDQWVKIRRRNSKILDTYFSEIPLIRQVKIPENFVHSRYKYYAYLSPEKLKKRITRDIIIEELNAKGIPCFSGSCSEIYLEKAFTSNKLTPPKRLPNAQILGETSLMFLVDPTFTVKDMHHVASVSKEVMLGALK